MGEVEIVAIAKESNGKERKVTVRAFVQVRDIFSEGQVIEAIVTDNFTGEFLEFKLDQLRMVQCSTCKNFDQITSGSPTPDVCQTCYVASNWEDGQKLEK